MYYCNTQLYPVNTSEKKKTYGECTADESRVLKSHPGTLLGSSIPGRDHSWSRAKEPIGVWRLHKVLSERTPPLASSRARRYTKRATVKSNATNIFRTHTYQANKNFFKRQMRLTDVDNVDINIILGRVNQWIRNHAVTSSEYLEMVATEDGSGDGPKKAIPVILDPSPKSGHVISLHSENASEHSEALYKPKNKGQKKFFEAWKMSGRFGKGDIHVHNDAQMFNIMFDSYLDFDRFFLHLEPRAGHLSPEFIPKKISTQLAKVNRSSQVSGPSLLPESTSQGSARAVICGYVSLIDVTTSPWKMYQHYSLNPTSLSTIPLSKNQNCQGADQEIVSKLAMGCRGVELAFGEMQYFDRKASLSGGVQPSFLSAMNLATAFVRLIEGDTTMDYPRFPQTTIELRLSSAVTVRHAIHVMSVYELCDAAPNSFVKGQATDPQGNVNFHIDLSTKDITALKNALDVVREPAAYQF
ncbi:hypothetical protein IW261DRAFT_1424788 [Armillaria novae-zelandiae]|uniref:Uncharacterized protein n=1 Tax=Armillaria novae-zelandiae TaxID=153914 RepID=A0AA39UAR3_9AGAR|nr:hypothetical protein IW261DRAFT_1424788 [Armillaria novae-zelandiae]